MEYQDIMQDAQQGMVLIPFDHTYILYDASRPHTLIIAIFSLLPILILVFIFSWFLITREIETCFIALGQVINDFMSILVKKIVKFERPSKGQIFKADGGLVYGMPSSHSQFISFFITYTTLKLIYQWPYRLSSKHSLGSFMLCCAAFIMVVSSRLYFEYHNLNQVIVGVLLGCFSGGGYFLAVSLARDIGLVDWVLGWRVADMLYLKDSFNYGNYNTLDKERRDWLESK